MLSDFDSLFDSLFSNLSMFLSTPPILYLMELLIVLVIVGFFIRFILAFK